MPARTVAAASLANASASRLARQSIVDSLRPSEHIDPVQDDATYRCYHGAALCLVGSLLVRLLNLHRWMRLGDRGLLGQVQPRGADTDWSRHIFRELNGEADALANLHAASYDIFLHERH